MRQLNERGYTFIEAMAQLVVFTVFAGVLAFCMHYLYQFTHSAYAKEETEWELFVQYFETYLYDVVEVHTAYDHRGIQLEMDFNTVTFETSGQVIRKQVDNKGHEPALMRVQDSYYSYDGQMITIQVTFLSGLTKERSWYVAK